MMLEYIKPKLFNDIAIMAHNNTLGKELKILENESSDDGLKELKIWKDDAWFADWCKISPALADTDLKLYFYFTRTSLDEKISKISSVLSPDAQELLENLLSKSDIIVNKAMKESKNISYSEAATILEAMFTTLSAETTISKEHIVAFLTFSESRPELHVDAIGYLKSFTGTQISLAAVAYIVDFAEKSNKKAAIKEIADNWGKTRPELQKAIEKYSQ